MMTRNTVVGIFDDRDDAQRAIEALKNAGFASDDIGVTMRDRKEAEALVEDTGASAGAGAATGALAGGALGGLAGWLVGIGALAIPGIGPIVAAGPLAAALTGAAIGAAGGGLLGALTGMGVPEEEARWYESEVGRGGTLVTVRANGRFEEARSILREFGAREASADGTSGATTTGTATTLDRDHDTGTRHSDDAAETAGTVGGGVVGGTAGALAGGAVAGPPGAVAGAAIGGTAGAAIGHEATEDKELEHADERYSHERYSGSGTGGYTREGEVWVGDRGAGRTVEDRDTLQLREEELRARKETVEAGEVEVRKDVVSEQRTIDVPVTREEVVIERRPVDRAEAGRIDTDTLAEGETIRVPVREEQVAVDKEAVVTEEVSIGKRPVTEMHHYTDTVRREEAKVEGDVEVTRDETRGPGRP